MAVAIDGSREGDEVAAILISERRAKVKRRSSGSRAVVERRLSEGLAVDFSVTKPEKG